MNSSVKFFALFVLLFFGFGLNSFAQWSADPATNLQVCDVTGAQALPKIASTTDGGCYIAWFDNRNGNYSVYLQRLDVMGNKLWDGRETRSRASWRFASGARRTDR